MMLAFLIATLAFTGINESKSTVDYVAVDVRTRAVIGQRWADVETPIPVGSLVKPFTALAYSGAFPEFVCKGAASGCWLAHGHGRIRFREALAQSCNAYFLNLSRDVDVQTLVVVSAKFGIEGPRVDSAETRIGLGDGWRISPLALVRAYAELSSRGSEPRVRENLDGMELAARSGTAGAIGGGALAKTGTASRAGDRGHHSDGFTLVLAPADSPRVALLVRVRGVTGADAAKSAARILRELRAGR
jgi:cell division protein FtsI/penicillin-binding protein 2